MAFSLDPVTLDYGSRRREGTYLLIPTILMVTWRPLARWSTRLVRHTSLCSALSALKLTTQRTLSFATSVNTAYLTSSAKKNDLFWGLPAADAEAVELYAKEGAQLINLGGDFAIFALLQDQSAVLDTVYAKL